MMCKANGTYKPQTKCICGCFCSTVCFTDSNIAVKHHLSRRASFETDHPAFKQQTRKKYTSGRLAERNGNCGTVSLMIQTNDRQAISVTLIHAFPILLPGTVIPGF